MTPSVNKLPILNVKPNDALRLHSLLQVLVDCGGING